MVVSQGGTHVAKDEEEFSPLIPEHYPFWLQTKQFHIIINTPLQVFLPLPQNFSSTTSTFLPANTQSSSFLHSEMSKSSQSAMPHLSHTLKTRKTEQNHTLLSILNDIPHIHLTIFTLHSLQTMQIFSLQANK